MIVRAHNSGAGRRVRAFRRGLGDVGWAPGSGLTLARWCDQASPWNPWAYVVCLPHDISNVVSNPGGAIEPVLQSVAPTAPSPPPPVNTGQIVTAITPTGATDVAGNPTYDVTSSTPQQNLEDLQTQLAAFMASQTPTDSCSQWYGVFDPNCSSMSTLLAVGLAAAGALLLFSMSGGRS